MEWFNSVKILAVILLLLPIGLKAQDVEPKTIVKTNEIAALTDSTQIKAAISDSIADAQAQPNTNKSVATKYIPTQEDMKQTFFQGLTVSADVLNMGLYFLSSYGTLEASLRLNLLNTYFPVVELGMARCNKDEYNTKVKFSTNAPYLRVGVDYNVLKDKWQTNKLFVGLRYGITNFNYNIEGPDQTDPIWHETQPFVINSINATSHYAEFVFGCQVKVWSFVHMGWSVRYKMELHTTKNMHSHPYYIPGYGTTVSGSYWGATYKVSFDLNWGKKKPTVKEVIQNAIMDNQNTEGQPTTDVLDEQ